MEKMFKKEYQIPDDIDYSKQKDEVIKSILQDLLPLKKQGFIINSDNFIIDTENISSESEGVYCEFTSVSDQ